MLLVLRLMGFPKMSTVTHDQEHGTVVDLLLVDEASKRTTYQDFVSGKNSVDL